MTPEYLYLHVPFCVRRCSYCDFAVQAVRRAPVAAWLDAIETELERLRATEAWAWPLRLRTIYVGGGTPSLLGRGALAELRRRLEHFAQWDDATVEWTAEANPESLDEALARDWRAAGVNRISLGAQTFDGPALAWMGRLHGTDGPARAVAAARAAGFENVSVDLIFGLPERLRRDWRRDLECALMLAPEHVSLYGLTAEPGAPLGRWVQEGREQLATEDTYEREYLLAVDRLVSAGYRHYEVSNFAHPGRESRHNGAYWTGAAYLGLGPSAHSFLPPVRRWNLRDWEAYRSALAAGATAVGGSEVVDAVASRIERIWLGLRTAEGLPLEHERALPLARQWRDRGWAVLEQGVVRLTPHGWLLLDRLALELDGVLTQAAARRTAADRLCLTTTAAARHISAHPPSLLADR